METRRRPWWHMGALFIVGALVVVLACTCAATEKRPYVTTYDAPALAQSMQGMPKLCIVSFAVDPMLYESGGGELDVRPGFLPVSLGDRESKRAEAKKIATALATEHLGQLVRQFSSRFQVVGPSGSDILVYEPVTDPAQIAQRMAELGADLGLAVRDQFGWDWAVENTGVESYCFRACSAILGPQGQPVWQSCSKGSRSPNAWEDPLNLGTFLSGLAGVAPPVDTIVKDLELFTQYHPQLLLRLIEEDVAGQPHSGSLGDYFQQKDRFRRIQLVNDNDNRYGLHFP